MADEFDWRSFGCPLVQLKKTCAQMQAERACPKYVKLLVRRAGPQGNGQDDMLQACADWWQPILLRDAVAMMARTEKAVELRGDRQADGTNQVAKLLLAIGAGRPVDLAAELRQIHDRQLLIAAPAKDAIDPAAANHNGAG